jgi:Protein of unknown function (DUF2800)
MTAHAFLPPSGAADWSRCALWAMMNEQFPQEDTPESMEGTAAHWVMSELLANRGYSEGFMAPNGVVTTEEMFEGAELVRDTVAAQLPAGSKLHIEETVSITSVHENCFGTPDVWAFDFSSAHIRIIDYKFGHGFVDEYFNKQGLLYALGIIEKIKDELVGSPKYITVSFTIIQPRCCYQGSPVRTHSYTIQEAREHFKALELAALAALEAEPLATTGPQCKNCPGRHACPTLQRAAYDDAEYSSRRQPHNLTPQAAGLELRMLESALLRLEARVDGLRELTLANLKAGKQVPHYRAEPSKGKREWNVPAEQVITIGQMFGKDLSKVKAITPTQALKNNIDESVINRYSQIIPGSVKLVAENNQSAAKVFGKGDLQ